MADKAAFLTHLEATLAGIEAEGMLKRERLITSAQGAHIGIDLFVDKFSAFQQRLIRKLTAAICAALCYAIAWSCVELCKDQWDEKMATLDRT